MRLSKVSRSYQVDHPVVIGQDAAVISQKRTFTREATKRALALRLMRNG